MTRTLKWMLGGVAVVLATAALLQLPAVQDRLIDRVMRYRLDHHAARALLNDDALRVLVCGSSSPLADPDRAKACVAVIAGGKTYIVDTGQGSWNTLALRHFPGQTIAAVLLTHFHSDHIGDLGEFNLQTWAAGRTGPLPVYGPEGVARVVAGFSEAYALDEGYRVAHHGPELLSPARWPMVPHTLGLPTDGAMTTAFEDGPLKVSVFAVHHNPVEPAVGYRFDYKGRAVVISGDTAEDLRIVTAAKGADLLVHEAQSQRLVKRLMELTAVMGLPRYSKIFHDIPSYHTDPLEAAALANQAGVPLLLLYHLTPPPPNALAEKVFLRGMRDARPNGVALAHDGTLVSMPLAGGAPVVSRLDP
jgi:ribonuclease Z